MNKYSSGRYSGLDKYSRTKSPYRSTSSLSRDSHHGSLSNLRIDPDYFNLLNKSLGAHDASFMHNEDEECSLKSGHSSAAGSRYNSLRKSAKPTTTTSSSYKFDVNKLNKDYSSKYKPKSFNSSDYDLNNNNNYYEHYSSGLGKRIGGGNECTSGSESDFELSKPTTSYRYTTTSRNVTSKGNLDDLGDTGSVASDDSMSEYIHCRSFCPDSVSDNKLFVSFDC